jgi:flagellar hook-length control protein FliK
VTERQILPPGRKGGRFGPSLAYPTFRQAIEIIVYFLEDRVARSLLTAYRKFIERPPVVSVTLEPAASVSFQGAPARPARSEQPPASDNFASLIDSNAAAANSSSRAGEPSPPPSNTQPVPRRADDATAAEPARPRDNSPPDQPANNDAPGRDSAPAGQAITDKGAKPEAAKESKSKSQPANADDLKSMAKPDSGEAPAADSTDTKQDLPSAAIADAVAVAIPVTIPLAAAPTDVSATASVAGASSGQGGTAPLAIAAAAIAATASVTGAATAPAIAAATATSSTQDHASETTAAASVAIPDAKPAAMATAVAAETLTVAVQPTASADTAAATDVVLAASIAAPVVAKAAATTAKASPVAKNAAQADDQNTTADATDASAATTTTAAASTSTAQPITAAPRHGETGAGNTVKPDQSDGSSSTINAAHGHAVSAEATQTSAGSPNSNPQAPGTALPQLQPPPAATQAASSFNVTAATQATAVPLNGLAMEIAVTASSGKSRFEIRLDPAELGRIDVRIDVDRNGQVTSHLTVEKPETLSMLRQDAPHLQRALNDAGLSTNGGRLQFSLRDQPSSGQNNGNQSNPNAQRLIVSEEDTIAAAAGRSYGHMLSASGGVDIRV